MSEQRPASVTLAIRMLMGLMALAGLATVLVVVLRDEVTRTLAAGRSTDADLQPLSFVPVVVVLFIVFAGLLLVLVPFFRVGHNWARFSIAGLVAFVALTALAGMRTDPPTVFLVLAVVSLLIDAALMFFLWHRDTNAFFRGAWQASSVDF